MRDDESGQSPPEWGKGESSKGKGVVPEASSTFTKIIGAFVFLAGLGVGLYAVLQKDYLNGIVVSGACCLVAGKLMGKF